MKFKISPEFSLNQIRPTTLFIICGLSGSGKSTFAENILSKISCVISSDKVRKVLWGDENDQQNPQKVFEFLYAKAANKLFEGKNVTIDATSLTRKLRKNIYKQLKTWKDLNVEVFYFENNVEKALDGNSKRARVVPEEVIRNQSAKYQIPSEEEEYLNKIYKVENEI